MRTLLRFVRVLSLLACSWALLGSAATAQAVWTGGVSDAWFDGANWSGGVVPDALTDVTVLNVGNQPRVASGTATARDLDVSPGAVVTVEGTGTLEVRGDLILQASGGSTGALALGDAATAVKVFGAYTQDDPVAVTSSGGRVEFEGGATLGGLAPTLPFARLATGTVTLLADVGLGDLDATGGASDGAFEWVVQGTARIASGTNALHAVRIDSGTLTAETSVVTDLTMTGGTLFVETAADLFVENALDLQAGMVDFGNLGSSALRVGGSLTSAQAVTWGSGYIDMDGATTTVEGPGGTPAFLNRLRFKSGLTTLLAPVEIASWVGSAGGSVTGEWIELNGPAAFLSSGGGPLHKVRVKGGLAFAFESVVAELELIGGELRVISGQTLRIEDRAELLGGTLDWTSTTTAEFLVAGDLVASSAMTYGDGFIGMDGTTSISGPGGSAARVGNLRIVGGTCTLMGPVSVDKGLAADGGTTTGDWFELVGTTTTLDGPSSGGAALAQVRVVGGRCVAASGVIGTLELSGGILEVPAAVTLTVENDAELLGGQLEFTGSTGAFLTVLGDVRQVATAAGPTMNAAGALRCHGVWTADAAIDLGASFVELWGDSSVTGVAPEFENLRIAAGATVALLAPVRVNGTLASAGGTTAGQAFEFWGADAKLATGDFAVHAVEIRAGVTEVDGATVAVLKLVDGELRVPANKTLTVETSCELIGGTLGLDPLDTGLDAELVVEGNVTLTATVAAAGTGSGGTLRCEGIWFGLGSADFGDAFVELAGGATVLGSGAPFGRLRVVEGAASLNAQVAVTKELVVEEDAAVTGVFPLVAMPGAGGTLELSGAGTVTELEVVDGIVEAAGVDVGTLRITGGRYVATGGAEAGDVFLEGGELAAREGGALVASGHLELSSGVVDFEVDPAGATGLEARLEAGSVRQVGATAGAGLEAGVLACRGMWTGEAALDLGLAFVELGAPGAVANVVGAAPAFGRVRVVGDAASDVVLASAVPVTGRLEVAGGTSSGAAWELDGAELATGAGAAHQVRIVGGVVRAFTSRVDALELSAGELLVDAEGTLTVTDQLDLLGGTLAFDPGGGASAAQLLVEGDAHQVATAAGSVSTPDGRLTVGGDLVVDAPLVLGQSFVELRHGARLLGANASLDRLRIVPFPGATSVTMDALGGVGSELVVAPGARLELVGGGLVLLPAVVDLDGALEVRAPATLALGATTTLTVRPSGRLALLGNTATPASLAGFVSGGFDLVVEGSLAARRFVLADMGSVVMTASASVGPEGIHSGLVTRGLGPAGGPLLDLGFAAAADFIGLDFQGGPGDTNVRRTGGGELRLLAWGGALGGEPFEDDPTQGVGDPDGLVAWVAQPSADLVALDVTSSLEVVAGQPLELDLAVINQGDVIASGPWVDRVYLSTNAVAGDADDVLLIEDPHAPDLASGQLYTRALAPAIPAGLEGPHWLVLETDAAGDVDEAGLEADNVLVSAPLEVFEGPRPNLVASDVAGPAMADDGTEIAVTWAVANAGLGPTADRLAWVDRVYLSSDAAFGGDFLLGEFPIEAPQGGLAVDEGYLEERTVSVPAGLSGEHFLIVRTDALDAVSPETVEADNVAVAVAPIMVNQPDLPDLVGSFEPVVSPLGGLYTGAEVDVTFTITNVDADANDLGSANGAWVDRFWLSFDTTIQPGIDTLAFEVPRAELVGPGGTYTATRTVTLPQIAATWFLIGEADADADVAEGDEANTWFEALSVVAPAWTGSVSTTFDEGLASSGPGTQLVNLTGQATAVGSGILQPNVDLTVRVRRGDTRRVFDVTTNFVGAFDLTFEPMVGEAGLFELFADHPAVMEDPQQPEDSFVLHHMDVAPLELTASLAIGEARRLSLGISNPGTQSLDALTCAPTGVPAHLAVQNLVVPASLAPGASDVVSFDLVALGAPPVPGAPDTFTLDLGFDLVGASIVAQSVPLTAWVAPAAPVLEAVGLSAVVVADAAGVTPVRFHVVNTGGGALTGATLSLDGPAGVGLGCATSAPFVLAVPPALGTLAPGAARLVAFDLVPGACADLGLGATVDDLTVKVTGAEGSWSFPLDVVVGAAPAAGLTVTVQDAGTWWNPVGVFLGGAGARVSGATVRLIDGVGSETTATTNASGSVSFAGLDGGLYALEIEGPVDGAGVEQHVAWRGMVDLVPGATPTRTVYLASRESTLALTDAAELGVEPGGWELSYAELGPDGAARLRVDGAPLDLELGVGESAQFELTITNAGGAPAEGVEWFGRGLDDFVVVPDFAYLGELVSGASVPLVVTVTRTGAGDPCEVAGAALGLRYFQTAAVPVWRWASVPAFAPGACGALVGDLLDPADLPPPLSMPGGPGAPGPMSAAVQALGQGATSGAAPERPARSAPPTTVQNLAAPLAPAQVYDVPVRWSAGSVVASVAAPLALDLEIENTTPHLLGALDLDVVVRDAAGVDVTAGFTLVELELVGTGALDGDPALGNVLPAATATARLELVPAATIAAGTYRVEASLAATLEGAALVLDLPARFVRVLAAPRLEVEVLLPGRAEADWSTTPLFFEDAEPFPVGVVVRNTGAGPATDLALVSSGPRFVADPNGAPTFASVLDLEVDGLPVAGGWALQSGELGTLAPGAERRILWTAAASTRADLTGLPLQFAADGALVAPAQLDATELVHATLATAPPAVDDGQVDWLIAADPAPLDPLTGAPFEHFATRLRTSDASADVQLVTHVSPALGAPPSLANLQSAATIVAPGGAWHYLRFDDPGGALFDLVQVTRVQKAAYVGGLGVGGPGDVSRVWTTARWVDVTADGVPDFVRREVHIVDRIDAPGTFEYTLGYQPSSAAALTADIQLIDASVGGTQHLTLDAGPARAGEIYVLVGTLSGTQPGTPYGTVVAPINVDSYTLKLLTNPALQSLFGSIGVLDGQGRATAQVPVPAGLNVGAGVTAHHAFLTLPLTKPVDFVSNAVALFVVP